MKINYLLRRCIKHFLIGFSSVSTRFIPVILIAVAIAASPVWAKDKAKLNTIVPTDLGDDGPISEASLGGLKDLVVDTEGNLYFPDIVFSVVRQVTPSGQVIRIAGTGVEGYNGDGQKAEKAKLSWPFSLVLDPAGILYISDFGNNRVRAVNLTKNTVTIFGSIQVKSRDIVTVAGTGTFGYSGDGGPAIAAELRLPRGLALHSDAPGEPLGLYIADIDNNAIRRVDGQTGIISTVAGTGFSNCAFFEGHPNPPPCSPLGDGGDPTQAAVSFPTGIAFDSFGNLFILEFYSRVRKIQGGIISTIAGSGVTGFEGDGGPASASKWAENPHAPNFDGLGNLFIADSNNNRVRRLQAIQGEVTADSLVTTVVGNGFADIVGSGYYSKADSGKHPTLASVDEPTGLAFYGRSLYIVQESGVIRVVDGGDDDFVDGGVDEKIFDIGALGGLKRIFGLAADGFGKVFATELNSARISVSDGAGNLSTVAGTAVQAFSIDGPGGDPSDDPGSSGLAGSDVLGNPLRLAFDTEGNLYFTEAYPLQGFVGSVRKIQAVEGIIGPSSAIETVIELPFIPVGIVIESESRQYIADGTGSRIWAIENTNGSVTRNPIAGTGTFGYSGDDGPALNADIGLVFGLALDENKENLYFGDVVFGVIRRVNLPTGVITTVFQLEGPFGSASPTDLVVLGNNLLYVVDETNAVILRIDLNVSPPLGTIVAGTGPLAFPLAFNGDGIATEVNLDDPVSIAIDPQKGFFYTGELHGQRIRRLDEKK